MTDATTDPMTQNDTENADISTEPGQNAPETGDIDAPGAAATVWEWSEPKEEAALLVAQDRLTDEKIAGEVGISRKTLARWKLQPEFAARVAEHVQAARDRIRQRGISIAENRVACRENIRAALLQIVAERAEHPLYENQPGGTTGFLLHRKRHIGAGLDIRFVDEFVLDTGLINLIEKLHESAARDLGQRDKALPDAVPAVPAKIAVEYEPAKTTDADSEE